MNIKSIFVAIIVFAFCPLWGKAQQMNTAALLPYKSWPRYKDIVRFYQLNQERPAWVNNSVRQKELLAVLQLASSIGLHESDYQHTFFNQYRQGLSSANDTIDVDVRFTDAAIHVFSAVKGGSKTPVFGYKGNAYKPDLSAIVPMLKSHLDAGKLRNLFLLLQPRSKEYAVALGWFTRLQRMTGRTDFSEVRISSKAADSSNLPLLKKLYQLGITDTLTATVTKKEVQAYLRKAQRQFDLVTDGVLGKATLGALNISLQQRLEELRTTLNTLRWLEDIKQTKNALILNIPSANFMLYERGRVALASKVIVGKASTPTPALTSTITEVILYPYWNVPHKIATRELLPRIKRNIDYLQSGNYQVLNKQGKVLNPYQINWHALSPGYFPYLIRQSTGCDNALGIVKFNFYNPFTVYLHDTPAKSLFSSSRRFFSHGCMRVEKPIELAHFLLGFNRIAIDTLTEQGCLSLQSPIVIKIENPLPVIILYSTAWYNQEGEIRFYEDVYKRYVRIDPQNVAWLLKPVTNALVKTKEAISLHQ